MPLLQFYTSAGQLSAEDKQDLASTLTVRYARIMPEFFVNIVFHEVCYVPYHLHFRKLILK